MTYPSSPIPYSQDMEEGVIGSILINPEMLADVIFLKPEDFLILRHSYIFAAIQRLHMNNKPIDILTVKEELRTAGQLEDIGGIGYLTQLTLNVPTSVHAGVYGRVVQSASIRRKILGAMDEIRGMALDERTSLDVVLRGLAERYAALMSTDTGHDDPKSLGEVMSAYFDHLEMMSELEPGITGLETGFKDLDVLLDGFQPESFNIWAGRPGMGKSAALMQIALNMARRGLVVYVWSGEMSESQLATRVTSTETEIGAEKLRRGLRADGMDVPEWGRFVKAAGRLGRLNIILDTKPGLNPIQLETRLRREEMRRGVTVDLLIVDYIGLMTTVGRFEANNKNAEISNISYHLKQVATRVCPILAAAQLSRAVESRLDKRPTLSDLRDSGSLEQDADTVTLLYRDAVYNPNTDSPNMMELITAKHRHGGTGTVYVHFEKSLTRVTDARTQTIDLSGL